MGEGGKNMQNTVLNTSDMSSNNIEVDWHTQYLVIQRF